MKRIIIEKIGNTTHHGVGYTEHDGYSGTADNRWSLKRALAYEKSRAISRAVEGEKYQIEVNGKIEGVFVA